MFQRFILLLLTYNACFPLAELPAQQPDFKLLSPEKSGIDFINLLEEDSLRNVLNYQYLYNGGGVAAGDINNDGWCDLFFTGNAVPDQLYLNNGDGTFRNISTAAGINKNNGWSTGVAMADINNDGWLDIYVCRSGKFGTERRSNQLWMNNGNLTFTESAAAYGLDDDAQSTQAAFFDFDRDGDLDMFLLNHSVKQYSNFNVQELRNERDPKAGNKLYRNDGARFTDISAEAGIIGNPINFGLGVCITDIDNNGWPDIFCTSDYQEQDFLYLNLKNGTFAQVMQYATGHTSLFSMGTDFGDINNDGFVDFVVADMLPADNHRQKLLKGPQKYDAYQLGVNYGFHHQLMRNTLQLNNANGTFSEIGQLAGVQATDWSWAPLLADFNNDGFLDLYITNGYRRDFTNMDFLKYTYNEELNKAAAEGRTLSMLDLVNQMPSVKLSNYLYYNNGDLSYTDVTEKSGMHLPTFSNGAAYADLDNDGDLDVVVNNINETASIWINQSAGGFLTVQLKGPAFNPFGLGAKVIVEGRSGKQFRELYPVRGYQSSMDYKLHFGLGREFSVNVRIEWPDGQVQEVKQVRTQTHLVVDYADQSIQSNQPAPGLPVPLLEQKVLSNLNYSYAQNIYVDYKREPLLTWTFSNPGPDMASGDMNGDGITDVYISAAKGNSGLLLWGNKDGTLLPASTPPIAGPAPHDEAAVACFDADNDGDMDLLIAYGGNETALDSSNYLPVLLLNNGKGKFTAAPQQLPDIHISASCIRPCDMDGDGDLDLFIGAALLPGKYPLSTSSFLLENKGGFFEDITDRICPALRNAGMVTDAVWDDIDDNGFPDLLITGMWMPLRIFRQFDEGMSELIDNNGFSQYSGWWNCLLPFDADGDGDLDLLAGNTGTNFSYRASLEKPVQLYAKDFDGNGTIDPILCAYMGDTLFPMVSRDDLLDQINPLKKRFVRYASYADATMETIFPNVDLQSALLFRATTFETGIFFNEGNGRYVFRPLPLAAQFSPVRCAAALDANKDGQMDLLLAGNRMDVRPEVGRMDAGQGLLLRNIGMGLFTPLPFIESGVFLPDETTAISTLHLGKEQFLLVAGILYPLTIVKPK